MQLILKQLNAEFPEGGSTETTLDTAITNDLSTNLEQEIPIEQVIPIVQEIPIEQEIPVEQEIPITPHDDFDWAIDRKNVIAYTDEERQKYDKLYDHSFVQLSDGQLINGIVVAKNKTDVVVNIGFKSDGLISANEFRDVPSLEIGEEIEVMVVEKEDKNGNLHLSRKSAKNYRAWERIVAVNKSGEIVTGYVICKTKGGLIVDVFGLETFLPGSQIDVRPVTDYDQFVGKTMEFKVVKINEIIKNAVVSHKALIESDIEAQRSEIIGKLEKGQVLEGIVKNITDFGAFMDLGGLDGLLYITDISWGRISHPSEILKLDQKIQVVVLDFDDGKKRISLGLKQLTKHPWDVLSEGFAVGSEVAGKVVNIEDYGAFLEIQPGIEGLVHVSEITWANTPINSKEFFKLGDEYQAKIITLDKETRKMSLSVKQLTPDPWSEIDNKFPENSVHIGKVKNITPYGVFVELMTGIGGMIHISDLSWLKRINHPSDYVKVGEEIKIKILNIEKEKRKLTLGHKQLEEDPWDSLESVFTVGTIHQGTVIKKEDKGAVVQLQYGLEGFCPVRHLYKEDGKQILLDEANEFIVIEFDRNEKKIVLSHTRLKEKIKQEEEEKNFKQEKTEQEKAKKVVKSIQTNIEKSTLDDIGAFAEIKAKMKKDEAKLND